MSTVSLRPLWKLVLALVCALALVIGPISSAFADDGGTVTKEQLAQLKKASPEDREKVRKIAVDKYTDKICASVITEVIALPGQKALDICRDAGGKQGPEHAEPGVEKGLCNQDCRGPGSESRQACVGRGAL